MEQDIYDDEFEEPLGDEDGLDDYGDEMEIAVDQQEYILIANSNTGK